MIWMYRQKRWIDSLRGQARGSDLSSRWIIAISINAFALAAIFGVGADVHQVAVLDGRRCSGANAQEQEYKQDRHAKENLRNCLHQTIKPHPVVPAQVEHRETSTTCEVPPAPVDNRAE